MKYTLQQQNVIDIRDCNLLVSAAAGSGKTAVLVQRILDKIMDMKNPLDIDRILLVTFTRASAAEMKRRLTDRMTEAYLAAVKNGEEKLVRHLRRQMSLIRGAYISTIDGFCTSVLRNHFAQVGIDPAFRVAEEGELKLLKNEVLEAVLEKEYEASTEDFVELIERYGDSRGDTEIAAAILRLYDYAQSKPYPEKWLRDCGNKYDYESKEELFADEFVKRYMQTLTYELKTVYRYMKQCEEIVLMPAGPYMYGELVESELEQLERLLELVAENADYDKVREAMLGFSFATLSRKKDDSVDEDLREEAKKLRDAYKKIIQQKILVHYAISGEQLFKDVKAIAPAAKELARLVTVFGRQYAAAKRELGVVDFSDLEHMTIQIFTSVAEDGEHVVTTPIADAYRALFEEIYIDEYQDSNSVQETILQAICRHETGRKNLFMVGDVKQSIYKFRMAEPKMFVDKSDRYTTVEDIKMTVPEEAIINLDKNFRSRPEVLNSVNYFFDRLMIREVGGVEYDEAARLKCGADYISESSEHVISEGMWKSELMLILPDEAVAADKKELEAIAVANRIKELLKTQLVQDGDSLRPVKYGDMAILLRSVRGWDSVYKRVFANYGIPLATETSSGYFDSYEVRSILNLLSIINNPREDETLCAVLAGFFGGLDNEELAQIRIAYPKMSYYEAAMRYAGVWKSVGDTAEADPLALPDAEIVKKLAGFFEFYEKYREKAAYLSVKELIDEIVTVSGFETALLTKTNGEQRLLNLEMLKEKAGAYEKINYKGIYNFMRYIKQLRKYNVDYGQPENAAEDAVQLMTIHKSKGLEFPVCFVSGMNKQINMSDTRADILMDAEGGIGLGFVDAIRRVKVNSLLKKAVAQNIKLDTLGEELRVLYVALTRAKEKLIITAVTNENELGKHKESICDFNVCRTLPPEAVVRAERMLDWLLMVLSGDEQIRKMFEEISAKKTSDELANTSTGVKINDALIKKADMLVRVVNPETFILAEMADAISNAELKEKYEKLLYNAEKRDAANKYSVLFDWQYPYAEADGKMKYVPLKASVSKLKHEAMEEQEHVKIAPEDSEECFDENKNILNEMGEIGENKASFNNTRNNMRYYEKSEPIPDFIKKDRGELQKNHHNMIGSLRGTAYHRFFELLDYTGDLTVEGIGEQILTAARRGFLQEDQAAVLKPVKYAEFVQSNIGGRMKAAAIRGELWREQPFCIMVSGKEVDESYPADSEILIQGIIDALFIEAEEYIIVDYKTDRVDNASELAERYALQLKYYAKAIEQITGKRVKERIIYSVGLGEEISV